MNAFDSILRRWTDFGNILRDIEHGLLPAGVMGLPPVPKALLIASVCRVNGKKALVLVPDEATAHRFCGDIETLGCRAAVFAARDFAFRTTDGKSKDFEHKRLGVLGNILDGECDVCVCSAEAAAQLTIPPEDLRRLSAVLKSGGSAKLDDVVQALLCADYVRAETVDGAGQFAVRGGILDFFPPDCTQPVRVEFWGDEIDSMAYFDVVSQRRGDPIEEVKITPSAEVVFPSQTEMIRRLEELSDSIKGRGSVKARENIKKDIDLLSAGVKLTGADKYISLAYERAATVFDYFDEGLLFVCETAGVKEKFESAWKLYCEDIKNLFAEGVLFKGLDRFMLTFPEIVEQYKSRKTLYFDNFPRGSFDTPVRDLITVNLMQSSPWEGSLSVLMDDIRPAAAQNVTHVVFAGNEKAAKELCEDLIREGFGAVYYPFIPSQFADGSVNVLSGSLSAGVGLPGLKYNIITYGRGRAVAPSRKTKAKRGYKAAESFNSVDELHKGDYVVHSVHGIGIFEGIKKEESLGVVKDYIKIRYAGTDALYIPVTQLDMVSKYIAPHDDDTKHVKLSRLGSPEWEHTKSRVRGVVREMAGELIALYAKRLNTPGYAFSPDIDMQSDFERRFEYDETDDQLRCIAEIKRDMEKPHPMDRLLCGDVGFGKTEVALRAAFKCVADGKQCAILVPTTILAFQHYQTVMKRIEGFPVNVEMISRYRTPKQQEKILKDLRRGTLDILIGTHRLISADVQFKDLGLVIIDEEQRFGVGQKEKLKELFPAVDVLTMSATPIPRTLNMAMSGIRDMSVIEEAPGDRVPVQSYVIEYDEGIVAEAIDRELRRGGQVYYLYNKIAGIREKAAQIQKLAPEARIGVGHGRMSEEELSSVWQDLLEGNIDILVCTTIIETGVDVPNCNTLIIENADRMGLAQLHQLRGRVGRSARRASAYFTFTRGKQVSDVAERRLNAIREYTEFGSGFKIAMRDLEIRGAGSILGAHQHGHMEAVGYDMYLRLLNEAVQELQGGLTDRSDLSQKTADTLEEKECVVDISFDAHIPEKYIESVPHRLGIYRRIADIRTQEDADDVLDELIDRFGEPPESVKGLITILLLRNTAAKFGIYEIGQNGRNEMRLYMRKIDVDAVGRLSCALLDRMSVSMVDKPYITVKKMPKQSPIACLGEVLQILSGKF
ncbi:MAG: transcription-repair coupling factor [Clostridia bacterium]|nr:transcription-repair coupling factor [Clostridia bacterium]